MKTSTFSSPPVTGGSGGIGNVVGPSSAVNNNLAAFDTTTGKLLEDSGIATSQVATSQTAATAVARLALTGLARGARVYQTDNGFWYELTNAAAPSDVASWAIQRPVQTAVLTADFQKVNQTLANVTDLTLTGLVAGRWYQITITGTVEGGATAGAVIDFAGGTATATGVRGSIQSFDFDAPGFAGGGIITALNTAINLSITNTLGAFTGSFTIQVDAGGTLIPRFAQQVTNAGEPSTLKKYATLQAIDVTPE